MSLPTPYYQSADGAITLYHGDCRDILPEIEQGSVDLVLTDPPFFMPAQCSATRKDWVRSWSDTSILASWFDVVAGEMAAALARPGRMYTFCDSASHAVFVPALYRRFVNLGTLVWDKSHIGMGSPYRHGFELILHAFDRGAFWGGSRGQSDILTHPVVPSRHRHHPVDKPVTLLRELVAHGCRPGGLVLDPFVGGGSTLLAALETGRQAIGIEGEERYCEIAAGRLGAMSPAHDDEPLLAAMQEPAS